MEYQSFKVYESEAEKVTNGIRIAECMNVGSFDSEFDKEENVNTHILKELIVSDSLTCSYCNISFSDASEQRNHYKLDWHRYNLKRALSGNQSVPEHIFDSLTGDISSISGSDDESSEESDSDVQEPAKKELDNIKQKFRAIRHSKVFFENEENKIISLYKCLLQSKKENLPKDDLIKNAHELIKNPKKWIVIMIVATEDARSRKSSETSGLGGGHFAAAIVDNGKFTHHKTFHCYTVRAKQGGSQYGRDNRGGSHPKSAGASLRRYNEQALIQHVQEIMAAWSEPIKQCSLILYRATGPYNRGVLFGGKNPIFNKTDPRLRNIPFPTRRATFKEVKRVYDMLSSIEVYGSADCFKDKLPTSPDKRNWSPKSKKDAQLSQDAEDETQPLSPPKSRSSERNRSKERAPPQRELPGENLKSSSESSDEDDGDYELFQNEITISFSHLQEFEDTVPQSVKDMKSGNVQKKKKKNPIKKKKNLPKKKWMEEFERIQGNLVKSCEDKDLKLLIENLNLYDSLPEGDADENEENKKSSSDFTKKDFISLLNAPINEESRNTLLHLAGLQCLPEFITHFLTAGADPTIKNKNKLTPYVTSGDKETRNAYRAFVASHPDKYDLKKANIPEPLSEEMERELEERRKEKKKQKRIKEKIKKQENKVKKYEEKEKERFLALSDKEKCALAAERRLVASSTANLKSAKPPVLSRCFQCGIDITGKVPFEYGINRFCTISCLKEHRQKTNSFGKEI